MHQPGAPDKVAHIALLPNSTTLYPHARLTAYYHLHINSSHIYAPTPCRRPRPTRTKRRQPTRSCSASALNGKCTSSYLLNSTHTVTAQTSCSRAKTKRTTSSCSHAAPATTLRRQQTHASCVMKLHLQSATRLASPRTLRKILRLVSLGPFHKQPLPICFLAFAPCAARTLSA